MRRHVHGFLTGSGVEHQQDFLRFDEVAQPDQFLDERFVDLQPSGGVENQRVAIVLLRIFERAASDFEDVGFALADEDRDFDLLAEGFQLIHGGRTKNVRSHQQRGAALLEVVLPEPCKPTINTQAGLPLKFRPSLAEPRSSTNSSWMILMICWPGWMLWMTSWPRALVLTRSMKSRATLKLTSASSRASRTSRKESATLASEILPRPRRFLKAFWSLLLSVSNIPGT